MYHGRMKKKTFRGLMAGLFLSTLSQAHEFWIAPSNFRIPSNGTVSLQLFAGMEFRGEVWSKRSERTLWVKHYAKSGMRDITRSFLAGDSKPVVLEGLAEGTHLVALRSKPSYIELDAKDFNEYLAEDGIENIADLRTKRNETAKPSREFYQRCAKILIQSGAGEDDSFGINAGMPLEIIPLKNPYALLKGDRLSVQVVFQGRPLPFYTVWAWAKSENVLAVKERYKTDGEGIVSIPLSKEGEWMISLVRMIESDRPLEADYSSYWGSLTFELCHR